jgi:hypothetical protein
MSVNTKTGWSDKVRRLAEREYVEPARGSGDVIRIRFGDLKTKLLRMGFPQGHANQVASPLESAKFWKPLGLEMCSPKGQPRTVDSVLEFRFLQEPKASPRKVPETASERARRLTEKLRGLMKDEIAAHGGAEGFLRWVRSDEDEA